MLNDIKPQRREDLKFNKAFLRLHALVAKNLLLISSTQKY
jgi:hypothetical protein